MSNNLFEVRCPNKRRHGKSNKVNCDYLLGKISPTSMGEFHCRKCKIIFEFIINSDGLITYMNFTPSNIVDVKKMTSEDRLIALANA